MRRPWPTRGCCAMGGKITLVGFYVAKNNNNGGVLQKKTAGTMNYASDQNA